MNATKKTQSKKKVSKRIISKSAHSPRTNARTPRNNEAQKSLTSKDSDIINLILADHEPLKKCLKILKDLDSPIASRKSAYRDFAMLLECHSHCEEKALYSAMKTETRYKLKADAWEGEVEHSIADRLIEEVDGLSDNVKWSAKVKVLAELVEHHLEEEEEEMLPRFKKFSTAEQRQTIGKKYLALRSRLENSFEGFSTKTKETSSSEHRALN